MHAIARFTGPWQRAVAASVCAMFALPAGAQGQSAPGPGDQAPPITLNALTNAPDGAEASWERWGEGTTVIEFWGTWCAPCVAAIPHINELHDTFAPKGVNFLSVTYESPELVDRFRERMAIHTWVGHDTDRAMVASYGVRGWPTTFVVRDGVIVARTHPSSLSAERLAALVEGKSDPSPAREGPAADAGRAAGGGRVGADGRPVITGGVSAGLDPYSMLAEEQPAVQVIVRPAGEMSMSSSSGTGLTALGATARSVVPALYNLPRYAVEVDDDVKARRFDVIYRLPQEQREALMPMVRELVCAGMDVRLQTERREVDAYELVVAAGGVKLEPGLQSASGSSASSDGTSYTLTSASAPMSMLVSNLSGVLGAPVIDRTGVEGPFFLNLTLPMNPEALSATLEERAGLKLTPTRQEIEVTTIKGR